VPVHEGGDGELTFLDLMEDAEHQEFKRRCPICKRLREDEQLACQRKRDVGHEKRGASPIAPPSLVVKRAIADSACGTAFCNQGPVRFSAGDCNGDCLKEFLTCAVHEWSAETPSGYTATSCVPEECVDGFGCQGGVCVATPQPTPLPPGATFAPTHAPTPKPVATSPTDGAVVTGDDELVDGESATGEDTIGINAPAPAGVANAQTGENSANAEGPPIAVIAGAAVGVCCLLAVVALLITRRRRNNTTAAAPVSTQPVGNAPYATSGPMRSYGTVPSTETYGRLMLQSQGTGDYQGTEGMRNAIAASNGTPKTYGATPTVANGQYAPIGTMNTANSSSEYSPAAQMSEGPASEYAPARRRSRSNSASRRGGSSNQRMMQDGGSEYGTLQMGPSAYQAGATYSAAGHEEAAGTYGNLQLQEASGEYSNIQMTQEAGGEYSVLQMR